MPNPAENLNINLNQNLWGLVIGLASLGASEYFHLNTMFWFSLVVTAIMILSIIVTTFAYTKAYYKKKGL